MLKTRAAENFSGSWAARAICGGGEVLDAVNGEGMLEVAEFGACEFVGDGPCGENCCAGVELLKLIDAGLMEADDAGVGQIVFRSEAVRRIDEESQDEGRGGEDGQAMPVGHAAIQRGDGDQQHQRKHGQQIASEQRAAENAEEQSIGQQQEENAARWQRIGGDGRGGVLS